MRFKSSETRKAILEAARTLFLSQGYHGTSMRQIAQSASVTIGAIYHHFADKEAIFQAILRERHPYHLILQRLQTLPSQNLGEFIRQAAYQFVEVLRQEPAFLNLMLIEIVEFNGAHLPFLFEEIFPSMRSLFERVVQQTPSVRPIPVPILLRSFIGLFFSFYVTERLLAFQMDSLMRQNALEEFIQIYLHGILKEA